ALGRRRRRDRGLRLRPHRPPRVAVGEAGALRGAPGRVQGAGSRHRGGRHPQDRARQGGAAGAGTALARARRVERSLTSRGAVGNKERDRVMSALRCLLALLVVVLVVAPTILWAG